MIEIDPDDGAVRIELPHGESVELAGLPAGANVMRGTQRALFLEPEEAEVLRNMLAYVLREIASGKLRTRAGSDETLQGVLDRLTAAFAD
jgi:hypothetical protein